MRNVCVSLVRLLYKLYTAVVCVYEILHKTTGPYSEYTCKPVCLYPPPVYSAENKNKGGVYMKRIIAAGYTAPQILTRRAIFSLLTGTPHFTQCLNAAEAVTAEHDAVFLNCDTNPGLAEQEFTVLEEHKSVVLVYADSPLNGLLTSRFMKYSRCSLIICPGEAEIEDFRRTFLVGKMYHTVAARSSPPPSVPLPGYGFEQLTGQQQELLFSILRGDPLKVTADKLGTSLKSASNAVARIRKLFGNCSSNEELIENLHAVL